MAKLSQTVLDILRDHRDSIDRLDAILVYTLGERFRHTKAIGKLKAENELPPADPDREAYQISRLESLADEADLPKPIEDRINQILSSSIERQITANIPKVLSKLG